MTLPREPGDEGDSPSLLCLQRVDERCWTAKCPGGWEAAALSYSRVNPGQWHFGDTGLTWLHGRNATWVRDPSALGDICESRAACSALGIPCGWSVGNCARCLCRWLGEPQPYSGDISYVSEDAGVGFRCLQPGLYDQVVVYDASAYYFRFWERLPSLRCSPGRDGSVTWWGQERDELARRRAAADAIRSCKPLRNAVWGASLGSSTWRHFYCRGEVCRFGPKRGPFHSAATVLARAAWELTRQAAEETDSVYSHTDCVTCRGGLYPAVWEAAGLEVKSKHSGDAHIHNLTSIRVGHWRTAYYDPANVWEEPVAIAPRPPLLFGAGWAYDRRLAS